MKRVIFWVLLCGFSVSQGSQYWLSQPRVSLPGAFNGATGSIQVSANGRYLTFFSEASNLVSGDLNGSPDLFVHDIQTNQTQLVSTTSAGLQLINNGISYHTQVSDDGELVLFVSDSMQLPDADGDPRVYSKNLNTGEVINLSKYGTDNYFEVSRVFLSADGSQMFFDTSSQIDPLHLDNSHQTYRKDLDSGEFTLISTSSDGSTSANEHTELSTVSTSGRYVLMRTQADNLVGSLPNDQLVLKDLDQNQYELVTQQPDGEPSATTLSFLLFGRVSNIGSVVFQSLASDLVVGDTNQKIDLFLFSQGQVERISLSADGQQVDNPQISRIAFSGDGQTVVFESDSDQIMPGLDIGANANLVAPLYAYRVVGGELSAINAVDNQVAPGYVLSTTLNDEGALWMTSTQEILPGIQSLTKAEFNRFIYQYDWETETFTKPIKPVFDPNTIISDMDYAVLSGDQRWLLTVATSPNLSQAQPFGGDLTLMLLDRHQDRWEVVGRNVLSSNVFGLRHDMSGSGRYVVFLSRYFQPAGTLDLGSTEIFLLDRNTGVYTQITAGDNPRVNDDGLVVFETSNVLSPNDVNGVSDVYVYDSSTAGLSLLSVNPNTMNAGNDRSEDPDIGGTGTNTRVTFSSRATDLTGEPDDNSREDVFSLLIGSNEISRISEINGVGGDGSSEMPKISNQGNAIAFTTRSDNLTADDYSNAGSVQVIHHDINTATNSVASINQQGELIQGFIRSRNGISISDSGRFVSFVFRDSGDVDFSGDDDISADVVLVDTAQAEADLISDFFFVGANTDESVFPYVAEDISRTPALVGVVYTSGRILSGVQESPGHRELYMHQRGGGQTGIDIEIQGSGLVTGSLGINCTNQCDYQFAIESNISLVASPDPGFEFYAWEDNFDSCESDNPACQITLDDRPRTVKAIFLTEGDLIFKSGFE